MEINACNRGIVLSGAGLIQNNYIESPFTHITNKLLEVYTGSFNLIEARISGGGTSSPPIGANIRGGTQNRFNLSFAGSYAAQSALIFGPNARDNLVRDAGLPPNGLTNNATVATNRIMHLNPIGFNIATEAILFSGALIQNRTPYNIMATIESEGNVSSWSQFDSNGNAMTVPSGLYQGQTMYIETGDFIQFVYTVAPTWNWRIFR